MQKTDTVDPVALGEMTEYIISITNGGPSTSTHPVMTDTFPNAKVSAAHFSYQGGLLTSEPAISCKVPSIGATSGTLECTFATITKDKNITVRYKMKAESIVTDGEYSGTQGNDVNVKVDETETLKANNFQTEDTTMRRDAFATDLMLKSRSTKHQ